MATYQDALNQTKVPPFAELYEITLPTLQTYRFTSYPKDITCCSVEYKAIPIKRTTIRQSKIGDDGNRLQIELGINLPAETIQAFTSTVITEIKVKLLRYFPDTDIKRVIFYGLVSGIAITPHSVRLEVSPLISFKNKTIPTLYYQVQCNNSLGDKLCGVNLGDYTHSIPVDTLEVNGIELKSPVFAQFPSGYFTWGTLKADNDYRLITYHEGDTIHIQFPFGWDIKRVRFGIYAVAGCDKTPETCQNKFNNIKNFLGFPTIPRVNPVVYGAVWNKNFGMDLG